MRNPCERLKIGSRQPQSHINTLFLIEGSRFNIEDQQNVTETIYRQPARSETPDCDLRPGKPSRSLSRKYHDSAEVVLLLENAGATLLALPQSGHSTRIRQMRFDIVHTALEAYGWAAETVRAPAPDAAAISAMDEAFGWLALIPDEKFVLRRILGARALVHPLTRRHLFPWRRLAGVLGADHKSVQRWHGDGLRLLMKALK